MEGNLPGHLRSQRRNQDQPEVGGKREGKSCNESFRLAVDPGIGVDLGRKRPGSIDAGRDALHSTKGVDRSTLSPRGPSRCAEPSAVPPRTRPADQRPSTRCIRELLRVLSVRFRMTRLRMQREAATSPAGGHRVLTVLIEDSRANSPSVGINHAEQVGFGARRPVTILRSLSAAEPRWIAPRMSNLSLSESKIQLFHWVRMGVAEP